MTEHSPSYPVTVQAPHDLRALLAIMKSAKEKGTKMNIWARDIRAVEDAIAAIELHKAVADLFEGGFIDAGWKRVGINSADAQWAMELEYRLKPLRKALYALSSTDGYSPELVASLLEAKEKGPVKTFDNAEDALSALTSTTHESKT